MMKYLLVALLACFVCIACDKQEEERMTDVTTTSELKEGDLLFCVQQNKNAISDVTQGFNGENIPHVAIFHNDSTGSFALEASFMGVKLTPIDKFKKWLKLNKVPYVLVGRLKNRDNIEASVQNAMKYIGKRYDFKFDSTDDEIYCSELIQLCYKDKADNLIFKPIPMSFHDSTGVVTDYWKKYYARWKMEVPEGAPGSNPGNLSMSDQLNIVHRWLYDN